MKTTKKLLGLILAVVMIVSCLVSMTLSVSAMQIFAKTSDSTVTVDVEPSDTIADVKTKVAEKIGVDAENFSLVYAGTTLEDGKTLAEYSIQKESTLHVVIDGAVLDLEVSVTYSDSQSIDQNYNLVTETGTYTDVTKVKLEWTITDIDANRKDALIWDPDTLSWVDNDSNDVTTVGNGTATFTLTNLSSTEVKATVSFAQVATFTAPTVTYSEDADTDGKVTIGTVVKSDKTVDTTLDHDAKIGVTVTPVASDFSSIDAATATQYGTYTVTIGTPDPVATLTYYNVGLADTMTATLKNGTATGYQWERSTDRGATYTAVSGATNSTLVGMSDGDHNGYYRCVITTADGSYTTNSMLISAQ